MKLESVIVWLLCVKVSVHLVNITGITDNFLTACRNGVKMLTTLSKVGLKKHSMIGTGELELIVVSRYTTSSARTHRAHMELHIFLPRDVAIYRGHFHEIIDMSSVRVNKYDPKYPDEKPFERRD